MKYIELIESNLKQDQAVEFSPAASVEKISRIQVELDILLPNEYKSFLLHCDGVKIFLRVEKNRSIHIGDLVWDVNTSNKRTLETHKSKDFLDKSLFLFSDDGCGNPFMIDCDSKSETYGHIKYFSQVDNEIIEISKSYDIWLEKWCSGKLKV